MQLSFGRHRDQCGAGRSWHNHCAHLSNVEFRVPILFAGNAARVDRPEGGFSICLGGNHSRNYDDNGGSGACNRRFGDYHEYDRIGLCYVVWLRYSSFCVVQD
eukprot:348938_1